jgi:hypothetical protein
VHTMVVERERERGKIESEKHCATTPATSHGKRPQRVCGVRVLPKREWFQAQKTAFPHMFPLSTDSRAELGQECEATSAHTGQAHLERRLHACAQRKGYLMAQRPTTHPSLAVREKRNGDS